MGKGSPPPDSGPQMQSERFAREDAQRAAAEDKATRDAADARTRFTTNRDAAIGGARGAAGTALSSRGLSTDEFMPLIESEITRTGTSIPDLSENPGSYFGPDFTDVILNREQENRRAGYGRKINEFFTPSYASSTFSDTADDPFIDTILGEASGQAQAGVERARARGQLDETGYTAAINKLGQATTAGRSRANELGNTVIQRNRQYLNDIGNEARTGASGYTLGGTFDPTEYSNRASSRAADLRGTFEGDVRNAIGDPSQFYDLGEIINFGGREQGATNAPSSPLAEVLAKRETARTARRGIGGTGTF
jgi:hypothetical protein